jgi:hypothetical protein
MNVLPTRAFALVASSTFRSLVLACACLAIAAQSPAFSQGAAEVSFQQLYRKFYAQIETLDAQREYAKADRLMKMLTAVENGGAGTVSRRSKMAAHNRAVLCEGTIGATGPVTPPSRERHRSAQRHGDLERDTT